jgi:hypothetical protein
VYRPDALTGLVALVCPFERAGDLLADLLAAPKTLVERLRRATEGWTNRTVATALSQATGQPVSAEGMGEVIDGCLWIKDWKRFSEGRHAAREATQQQRTRTHCEECGFLLPGHSGDCHQVFKPLYRRCHDGPQGYGREEVGIRQEGRIHPTPKEIDLTESVG